MKKVIRLISLCLVCVILMLNMTSCAAILFLPPFSQLPAAIILKRSQSYYDEARTSESEMTMEISGTQNEQKTQIKIKSTQKETYLLEGPRGYEHRSEIKQEVKTSTDTIQIKSLEKYETAIGYVDGYMYMSYQPKQGADMGTAYNRKGAIKEEEYRELREKNEEKIPVFDPEAEFGEISYNYTDFGKTLTVTCDEYLDPANSVFDRTLSQLVTMVPVDMKVKTLRLEMTFDSLKQAQTDERMTVEMVAADNSDWVIKVESTAVFSLPEEGSTTAPEGLDTYKEVQNLGKVYEPLTYMNGLIHSEGMRFNQNVSVKVKTAGGSGEGKQSAYYLFGESDGVFKYTVVGVDSSGKTTKYKYDGEKQVIEKPDGAKETEKQNQAAARLFVQSCLSDFFYDPFDIETVSVYEASGTRTVTLAHRPDQQMRQYLAENGLKSVDLSKVRVTTTMISDEEGNVTSITMSIYCSIEKTSVVFESRLSGFQKATVD